MFDDSSSKSSALKSLIISSSDLPGTGKSLPGYEIQGLRECGLKYYDKIYLLNPNELEFVIRPDQKTVDVFFEGTSISNATALIVRNTGRCEEATRLMALSLHSQGCELLDPVERFNGSPAGKAIMTLKGMKDSSLPATYIAFNLDSALHLLTNLIPSDLFPLVGKPSTGAHGNDVQLLTDVLQAKKYSTAFFKKYAVSSAAIIFQHFIKIDKEYRVLLLDGELIGMAEKSVSGIAFGRNASNGSVFVAAENEEVGHFTLMNSGNKGLIGADVAIDEEGKYYIIEANRSPQWQAFEKATGINVADQVLRRLEKRLAMNSELF